jgi:hypothetical protein
VLRTWINGLSPYFAPGPFAEPPPSFEANTLESELETLFLSNESDTLTLIATDTKIEARVLRNAIIWAQRVVQSEVFSLPENNGAMQSWMYVTPNVENDDGSGFYASQ